MTDAKCPACGAPLSISGGSCSYCGAAIRDSGVQEQTAQRANPEVDFSDGFSVPESEVSEPLTSEPLAQAAKRDFSENPFPQVTQIPSSINMGRVNTILASAKKYLIIILLAIVLLCVSCSVIFFVLLSKN